MLQARASSNAPSNVRAWTLQTSQCRQQNESLQCNFSVFEYDLWGRSRAINKSAALRLDGLSEARRSLSIQGLHDGRLPVGTLVESHQDVRHSVDVEYVPATLQRVSTASACAVPYLTHFFVFPIIFLPGTTAECVRRWAGAWREWQNRRGRSLSTD